LPSLIEILEVKERANSAPIMYSGEFDGKFHYSGGGYCIVQKVMEDVSREPFEAIVRKYVFEPFGMNNSSFVCPIDCEGGKPFAKGH